MTLIEAVRDLDSLDADGTIYASEPWSEASRAVVAREPESGGMPLEAQTLGLKYFIEVAIAKDFLGGWRSHLTAEPTLAHQCERLIAYAINDA